MLLLLSCWVTQADPPQESSPVTDTEETDPDADGDGYPASTDCDDSDSDVNPGQTETCATTDDEDCDGVVDEAWAEGCSWYEDGDGDGFGSGDCLCHGAEGRVQDATDCDDAVAEAHPGAEPACDGRDLDCDGAVDSDEDEDGFADFLCGGDDCDDGDAEVTPATQSQCAMRDCKAWLQAGSTSSGLYLVDPSGSDPFQVWCDMETGGGGWALVMDRSYIDECCQGMACWNVENAGTMVEATPITADSRREALPSARWVALRDVSTETRVIGDTVAGGCVATSHTIITTLAVLSHPGFCKPLGDTLTDPYLVWAEHQGCDGGSDYSFWFGSYLGVAYFTQLRNEGPPFWEGGETTYWFTRAQMYVR